MGGKVVVSEAFVRQGVSSLIPKLHVKRGDMVMLVRGSKKVGKGQTGKVLNVFPREGKIVVEGVNLITRATKQRTPLGKSGLVKKEAPVFASRVMLFCTSCKKPTRIKHKVLESGKKSRICKHCSEAFDS
ncbi:MAG: 50S ribosomal protein L24 [Candidatus Melainabacteria bacterium]|nr:50S ribosomal protein L24 [Candidatus Melainabacteria bacterium]